MPTQKVKNKSDKSTTHQTYQALQLDPVRAPDGEQRRGTFEKDGLACVGIEGPTPGCEFPVIAITH